MTREEVFAWCKSQYETEPDYPWRDNNAVLRHKSTRKWYGVVLEVGRDKLGLTGNGIVDVINVKGDPSFISVLQLQEGFRPAYHMNKENWISILLDGSAPEDEIKNLIDMSYQITKPKH